MALGYPIKGQYIIGLGNFFAGVAQQRKIGLVFFSKGLVVFQGVDAGHKIGDIQTLEQMAILRQRFTLDSAAAGKGLRVPSNDNGLLVVKLFQAIGFAIGGLQREPGRLVANF